MTRPTPLSRPGPRMTTGLGPPPPASSIPYDPTTSGLAADDMQEAIDELAAAVGAGPAEVAAVEFIIDGGGATITTGIKGYLEVPFAWSDIQSVRALADASGSIVVDIWKDTYANAPPDNSDSITASAPVTLSSAVKSEDTTLTGWTQTGSAGDWLGFNVDSVTTCQRVTISLVLVKA